MERPLNLFISHAPADEQTKRELAGQIIALQQHTRINILDAGEMRNEEELKSVVKNIIGQADIMLLLVSENYLANTYLWEKEFALVMERYATGEALLIPVITGDCEWKSTPLGRLQVLPEEGTPLNKSEDKRSVYAAMVRTIEHRTATFFEQPKWQRLIEREMAEHTGRLVLQQCELTSIPAEVAQMTWLTVLDLSYNQITRIEGLDGLNALTLLNLSSNQITRIEGLDGLTKLIGLNLSSNQITRIEGLDGLTKLTRLDLSSNQITRIEGLDGLTKLDGLILSSNQITRIEGLDGLTKLIGLNLSSNQITRIEGLDGLTKLTKLNLSYNQITRIEGLDGLTKLNWLNLSSNQITRIEGLDGLTKLTRLNLSSNQITKIETLEIFPEHLQALYLFNNPITNVELTVFGDSERYNCLPGLKSFFAERAEMVVPEVNLILTGNSDAGKTSFRTFFATGKWDTTRNSTHGLEVHPYRLSKKIKEQYGFPPNTQITLWDFGGQEYFHNTHQLFFNQNAVYLFLWEKGTNQNKAAQTEVKRDENSNSVFRVLEHFDADYWLSNIRHFAQDAAILIVQNKVDQYAKENEPVEWLPHSLITRYKCNHQYHISIVQTHSKNLDYWYDFEKLKHLIFKELQAVVSKNKEGNIYNKVRKAIVQKKADNYWTAADFVQFIEGLKTASGSDQIEAMDNRQVVKYFAGQGKLLYPANMDLEEDKVLFTNPQWVSQKIYDILDDTVLQRNGFFDEKDLQKLVDNGRFESRNMLMQVVDLMKQYNIVFYNPNRQQYIAPQYLPEVPTVHYSQVKKLLDTPAFVIRVNGFLPKSVINNIIAKYALKDDAASFYKYGVKTEAPTKEILLIEVAYSEKKLYVYTNSTSPVFLRKVFADILIEFGVNIKQDANTEGDGMRKLRKMSAPVFNEPPVINLSEKYLYISLDDTIFVDWKAAWEQHRDAAQKDKEYIAASDGNPVLRKLFLPFYLPYPEVKNIRSSDQLKPAKLFISYSSKNTAFMRRLETHLAPLQRNGTIALWHDRMIEPGTRWDDSIKAELANADIIVFLLSPDFIATNYIFEHEIPHAIQQLEGAGSKLFFVELQSCSWHRTVLAQFQQTTKPDGDNKGVLVIGDAMNDEKWKAVVDELEKKITKPARQYAL